MTSIAGVRYADSFSEPGNRAHHIVAPNGRFSMAKKKKTTNPTKPRPVAEDAPKHAGATTAYTWLGAVGGALLVLSLLLVPWLNVAAASKNGLTLIRESFSGNPWVGVFLILIALTGALAAAIPFLSPRPLIRDWANTTAAIAGGISILVMTILTSSTRNLLAFGAGRQRTSESLFLVFLSIALLLAGTVGNLLYKDLREVDDAKQQLGWYAAFLLVLVAILYFNYSVIPHSIIEPPEFVRQRMGWN